MQRGRGALLPIIVFLAIDAAVLAEAGELRLQVEFALAALEAAHVPLLVHGQQVVAVRNLPAAACAQGHALCCQARHGLWSAWNTHQETVSGSDKSRVFATSPEKRTRSYKGQLMESVRSMFDSITIHSSLLLYSDQ